MTSCHPSRLGTRARGSWKPVPGASSLDRSASASRSSSPPPPTQATSSSSKRGASSPDSVHWRGRSPTVTSSSSCAARFTPSPRRAAWARATSHVPMSWRPPPPGRRRDRARACSSRTKSSIGVSTSPRPTGALRCAASRRSARPPSAPPRSTRPGPNPNCSSAAARLRPSWYSTRRLQIPSLPSAHLGG